MKKKNPPYYTYMKEFETFRDLAVETSEKYADRMVYAYRKNPNDPEPQRVTYAAFLANVRAVGTGVLARGLHGKHVAVIGKLSYEWATMYMSLLSVGAVLVPLDPDWSKEDLCETILKADCAAVFYEPTVEPKLDVERLCCVHSFFTFAEEGAQTLSALRAEGERLIAEGDTRFDTQPIDPLALAEIVFTSGTTGKGKGVMLSQKALLSNLFGAFAILKIDVKTIGVLPPHHTYGSTIALMSAFANGTQTYISSGLRYLLKEMEEEKPRHLILVPLYLETFYRRIWSTAEKEGKDKLLRCMIAISNALRKIGIDLRRPLFSRRVLSAFGGELHTVVCGGAPLSQTIIDSFDDLGVCVINGYGITECSPLISANRLNYIGRGSVGVPIPAEQIRIDHPNADGVGEICVRGPHVMMGYYRDEEATAAAIDADGFFHTGDIGKTENDLIYVTGRMKNLIILSNGKNVYPEEIESALLTVPGVSEIVVYEGSSRRGTEHNTVVAEIYPDAAYLEQNGISDAHAYFSTFVNDYNRTAVPYKKIGLLRIRTEDFPKNTLRKIMRFKIDHTID